MSIKVELPTMYAAMNEYGSWGMFTDKPHIVEDMCMQSEWFDDAGNEGIAIEVSGFVGDWKDSLHQWNGNEWVKI